MPSGKYPKHCSFILCKYDDLGHSSWVSFVRYTLLDLVLQGWCPINTRYLFMEVWSGCIYVTIILYLQPIKPVNLRIAQTKCRCLNDFLNTNKSRVCHDLNNNSSNLSKTSVKPNLISW